MQKIFLILALIFIYTCNPRSENKIKYTRQRIKKHSTNIVIRQQIKRKIDPFNDIKSLNGIWIAKEYYNSFEKTKSIYESKKDFDPIIPVGLRINTNDIKNGILNIGYSLLHGHDLHPEVSKFIILRDDTLYEQGSFEVNLNEKDSVDYIITTDIYYHNSPFITHLSWSFENDTTIILKRPSDNGNIPGKKIEFKRIVSDFENDYQYPNPIYYYTRSRTLEVIIF